MRDHHGGVGPTGTITFSLYGPNNATCTVTPIFTSTVVVSGNGSYVSTPVFTPASAGTYRWIANYSDDANNTATVNVCNAANENLTVSQAAPGVGTTASATVTVGGTISDTALLSGGVSRPTWTITINLYGQTMRPVPASRSSRHRFRSPASVQRLWRLRQEIGRYLPLGRQR